MINSASLGAMSAAKPAMLPSQLSSKGGETDVEKARDLKETFAQFVGETFYGEMLKSMRSSVGKPAYFHGGMAEEQFQSQLDMHISQDLATSDNNPFAEGMFAQQFPDAARLLEGDQAKRGLDDLGALRRR